MKSKTFYILCYSLLIIVILSSLFVAYQNFSAKETAILNQGEVLSYKVVFDLNGADTIDKHSVSCIVDTNGCKVILPMAKRNDGEIIGYNLAGSDIEARFFEGEEINLSGDMILYVISKKTNYVYIDSHNVDVIENDTLKCNVYNRETNCSVILPNFNKIGYEVMGYSTSSSSLTGFIYPHEKYKISRDVMLYPVYGLSNHLKVINVEKIYQYQDSYIEVENTCRDTTVKEYLSYLEGINTYAPFLMIGSKITMMGDVSFNTVWGKGYVGMNYGPKNLRMLDIRCSDIIYNDYYATMVHEMSHSWDFYYATKLGSNISSQSDVINLFNKYKNMSNRPFRDYSYSIIYEFQADMVKYYYFKYLLPTKGYVELDYPEDIKKVVEKYICIANHDYKESMCK